MDVLVPETKKSNLHYGIVPSIPYGYTAVTVELQVRGSNHVRPYS